MKNLIADVQSVCCMWKDRWLRSRSSALYLNLMGAWTALHSVKPDCSPRSVIFRKSNQITEAIHKTRSDNRVCAPYKRRITQFMYYFDRSKIKADCWEMARHSNFKWLLGKYTTTLLLHHYEEPAEYSVFKWQVFNSEIRENMSFSICLYYLNFKLHHFFMNRHQVLAAYVKQLLK